MSSVKQPAPAARHFHKPRRFDANLVVIGGGAAGLVSAYVAAAARARVVLIEAERMGGECLHTGCVPSKTLIRSARLAADFHRAAQFGLRTGEIATDFDHVMARIREVITRIEPHDSVERYTALGVECVRGRAHLRSPWEVQVDDRVITTRSVVIATGSRPTLPDIPGLPGVSCLTSDTLWDLRERPSRLAILGGGAVGCEMAQAFRRLGSRVNLIEALPQLLARDDEDVSQALNARFTEEGIEVITGCQASRVTGSGPAGSIEVNNGREPVTFDRLLVAAGRRPRTEHLGLEPLGIQLNANGTIRVNKYLQTDCPNVYACGDVAGPYQLTHAAAHQAWYCATNALFAGLRKFRVDYSALPQTIFTDPEIARVGLNEREARERGIAYEVTRYGLDDLDRAIADGDATGFVKVLTPPRSDRILGVTIVGSHAGDLLAEFVLAMRHELGLRKVLSTVHSYPTWAEANRFVAGAWQQAHLPERLLQAAEWFHRVRR